MKRKFIVTIDIKEDPDHIVTENFIEDAIIFAYDDAGYTPERVWVSEEPVVSLEYLQSLDNTPPPHIQEVIDARVLQHDIMTPEEIRNRFI